MPKPWPLLSSQTVADLGILRLDRDRARSPRTGRERDFAIIHMPDWLQVVALTPERRLVMVRQYRHASRRLGLEVPGGLLDPQDPNPAQAAARELREETGYGGGVFTALGRFWPQPALLANRVHFFALTGVGLQGELEQDEGEDLEVVLLEPGQVPGLVEQGEIHNAMTVMALNLAQGRGLL